MKSLISLLLFIYIFTACSSVPETVQFNLDLAHSNKSELESIIDHYKDDEEKLKAAFFLLENMDSRGSIQGEFKEYHDIFSFTDSLIQAKPEKKKLNKAVKERLSLLEKKYGPVQSKIERFEDDLIYIKADYLIKNIDLAFDAWKNNKWAKDVDFETFCNYILPYRIHDEPLSDFRSFFIEELSWLEDSMKDPTDVHEACLLINNFMHSKFTFVEGLGSIPFPSAIDMYKFGAGECEQRYFLIVSAMRSVGVPVAIDFSPQYNHWAGKHSWVSLITNDSIVPFNAGEYYKKLPTKRTIPVGMETSSTVFRNCFAKQHNSPLFTEKSKFDVPVNFRKRFIKNVSADYNYPMTSVTIEQVDESNDRTIYLGCFGKGKEIIAVDYLPKGENKFKHIGKCGVYVPFFFKNNKMEMISYPFILSCEGDEKWYSHPQMDNIDTIIIGRKYPVQDSMASFSQAMVGGYFEASNKSDFSISDTLHVITKPPHEFVEVDINSAKQYKYVRYVSVSEGRVNIAEINFYNGEENLRGIFRSNSDEIAHNAFDGDIRTNYTAPAKTWLGIELNKIQPITKIRFLARNNFNIVEPGDIYELFYFEDGWKTLSVKKAKSNQLKFTAPQYSLLLLKNITKGKKERIFKYENHTQIFW